MHIHPLPVPPHYFTGEDRTENNWLQAPTAQQGRPPGDQRNARQIINANPALKNLLKRRDSYPTTDLLKRQVGDWTSANPNAQKRADAAYDLARVLNYIDNVNDRKVGNSESRDGKINGFHNAGHSTRKNSEARLLVAFAEKGYEVLANLGR
ncbi:hypothetical protein HX787_00205 [Pseudomonas tolaasii]|uniref:Uncharacterized protein n=2 Tax=Pseudomonas tolaasii TaxID=29442 RepID=A0A7Y8AHH2_PSETO|nr:hypothetical protein [Pseudomonas tolaasii]ARB27584.1 hypothetical protein B5P22_09970 [Pseudomonas tolaasii]KAB0467888.1 hypothetical protein F7R12_24565 [Pseudomonas tolaasii]MBY8943700.1 hypothetical protein [Pseudomonas tolaasii]NWC19295.1 hypothetical protein [Pseudomonas tolaasii]NWC43188.1 hypothetical protein [Pseudomonas tolaasii]